MIAIKHLGTNGGGWFGANSAHPLENPNYLTYMVEMIAQVLLPVAMIFAMGFYIKGKKLAVGIYGVMTVGMQLLIITTLLPETGGKREIVEVGIGRSGRDKTEPQQGKQTLIAELR